jgi:hypothetical protein
MKAFGLRLFVESLLLLRTCGGTMNHIEKLRRSAMSIAVDAPRLFMKLRRSAMSIAVDAPRLFMKLRRSAMFVRRFMQKI